MSQLPLLISGCLWLGAGVALLEVARLLGPAFDTTHTAHPVWRFAAWLAAVVFFGWGVIQLFPGHVLQSTRTSAFAPLPALAVLGVTLALLDWVMREREPPPWSVRFLRLLALFGWDRAITFAAMALPPAGVGDALPREDRGRSRLPILVGAVLLLTAVALFLAVNSPAGSGR